MAKPIYEREEIKLDQGFTEFKENIAIQKIFLIGLIDQFFQFIYYGSLRSDLISLCWIFKKGEEQKNGMQLHIAYIDRIHYLVSPPPDSMLGWGLTTKFIEY